MPLSETYRRDLAQLQEKEAALKKALAKYEDVDARAMADYRKKIESALKASSRSTQKSYYDAAERLQKSSVAAKKKIAETSRSLAANAKQQSDKIRNLQNAQRSEQRAEQRTEARRRTEEKRHAMEIASLSAPRIRYISIQEPVQERLRILYLTADPALNGAGDRLRVDQEVRQVQNALRGAKYRDQIEIHQRPAATFQDLLDGLNDVSPHIVHFSGHGGGQALLFDVEELSGSAGKEVTFGLLVKALGATDHSPKVLVMNACDTLAGSDAILPAVPVVIAMSAPIGDLAAVVFAQQLYAAIASGQSVGNAIMQGKVAIEAALADTPQNELPQFVARDDVDVFSLALVVRK